MLGHGKAARLATVSILAAAITVPTAGAGRYGPGRIPQPASAQPESHPAATCHQYCGTGVAARRGVRAPASHAVLRTELVPGSAAGFQWGDAAVGFAVACGGILLAALALLGVRRARLRPAGDAS
jgi:hypothetical protein